MVIVSQNGKVLVNMDNVLAIEVSGNYIHAHPSSGGHPIALGRYESGEDAQNTFDRLVEGCSSVENVRLVDFRGSENGES